MTFTSGSTVSGNVRIDILTNDSTDTSNNKAGISGVACYLWGAQIEQSSTAGEYVKTTSTINSAPRFDHNPATGESLGLLLEENRTNLITNSDLLSDFNTSSFGAGNSSVVTATAPDNGTQVFKLLTDSSNTKCRIKTNATSSNNVTVSAFVKKNTHRYVLIGFGGASNSFVALFDIEPGVTNRLISQDGAGTFTNIDAGYQDYANGWVRIWAVGTSSGTDGLSIAIVEDETKTKFSSNSVFDGTESIYVWGAQYEDNVTFPTSYIRTDATSGGLTRSADVASIEGNDFGTFNLLPYSEEFDNSVWGTASLEITPNAAVAPDGSKTAEKWLNTGTTAIISNSISKAASAITYTASLWVKSSDATSFSLTIDSGGTGDRGRCVFDLTTGELVSTTNDGTFTGTSGTITAHSDSWYRLTVTTTTNTGSIARWRAFSSGNGDIIYFWGAQLEESSTATHYVKSDVTWTSRASNATYYDYTGTLKKSSYNRINNSDTTVAFSNGSAPNTWTSGEIAPDGTTTARKCTTGNRAFLDYYVSGTANKPITYSVYLKATSSISRQLQLKEVGSDVVVTNIPSIQLTTEWQRFEITGTSSTDGARS